MRAPMTWPTPSVCCRSWTGSTLRLLDRGSANAPMLSQTGPRILKNQTYPHGCNTPGGDESRNLYTGSTSSSIMLR